MKLAVLEALEAARAEKRAVVLLTELATGEQRVVDPRAPEVTAADRERAARALAADRCELDEGLFVHPHNPPLRLIVVGAVHVAQALVPMAQLAGYDVTVVDPRSAFASAERFPGVRLDTRWPDEAMAEIGVDARCAVVVLSHDPKIDDPALSHALATPAFYIGALGSSRTHAARVTRLRAEGAAEIERIFGPIGLPLGGRSAAEIAISILAQMTQVLRSGAPRRFAAIVLAAGASRRMGERNKLLCAVDGAPMVARAVRAAAEGGVRDVVVVTGHDAARVREALAGTTARFVHNPDFAAGMSSSLRAGAAAIPADVDGVFVLLGDMPWVRRAHLAALMAAFAPERGASICVPSFEGRRGNPVLWARRHLASFASLEGDVGARGLLDACAPEVRVVEVGDAGVLRDVDTAAELP